MHQAFEEAWSLLAARYGNDQDAAERARLRLADCVHRVTSDASMDVSEIKRRALDMLLIIDNIYGGLVRYAVRNKLIEP